MHDPIERLTIVSPTAKEKPKIMYPLGLGIVDSGLAIMVGCSRPVFVSSPAASKVFPGIAAGQYFESSINWGIQYLVKWSQPHDLLKPRRSSTDMLTGISQLSASETLLNIFYVNCITIMRMLSIDDQTYKRLGSIMNDIMNTKKRDVSYDDVINELIDVYQDRLALSGENAGG